MKPNNLKFNIMDKVFEAQNNWSYGRGYSEKEAIKNLKKETLKRWKAGGYKGGFNPKEKFSNYYGYSSARLIELKNDPVYYESGKGYCDNEGNILDQKIVSLV